MVCLPGLSSRGTNRRQSPSRPILIDHRLHLAIERHLGSAGVVELEAKPADPGPFERVFCGRAHHVCETEFAGIVPGLAERHDAVRHARAAAGSRYR